jgi:uncharacterized protein (DUF2249 family)
MSMTLLLDTSEFPPRETEGRLLEVFDRATVGDTIKLVSEHTVAPVCELLYEEREGQFVCRVRRESPGEWVANIVKTR